MIEMTEYKAIPIGEVLQKGDEFFLLNNDMWVIVPDLEIGSVVGIDTATNKYYRRKERTFLVTECPYEYDGRASYIQYVPGVGISAPKKELTIFAPDMSGDDICADVTPTFKPWARGE